MAKNEVRIIRSNFIQHNFKKYEKRLYSTNSRQLDLKNVPQ